MKHILTITGKCLRAGEGTGCGNCANSCQSACKTSCTVANQTCHSREEKVFKPSARK